MTFDDDFIQIDMQNGMKRYHIKDIGMGWPPPERLNYCGFTFVLESCSAITDEQRADMTHVCRGARYVVAP